MNRWIGRTAVVAGASDGIGRALCKKLVQMGMTVLGCDRNVDRIKDLGKELHKYPRKFHVWRCDMSIESDIFAMYDYARTRLGSVDVCINNAFCCINSPLLLGKTDDWKYMLEVGIEGACISAREAIRLMNENFVNDGLIIQVGSNIGPKFRMFRDNSNLPYRSYDIYNGIKIMNKVLADGLRQELKAKNSGIRVTTVSLESVEAELFTRQLNGDIASMFFAAYKYLHPKDIVEAVVHILQTPLNVSVKDIVLGPVN